MTVTSVVMQIVTQIQFIGMMSRLDIDWPTEWFTFTAFFDIANLSFENFVGADKIPLFTFRMVFILVSICVPLAINVLLLLIFQPMYVVLWYVGLVVGIVMVVVGLAGRYLPGTVDQGDNDPMGLIIAGAILVSVAVVSAMILAGYNRVQNAGDEEENFREQVKKMKRFHRLRALQHFCVFIILFLVGGLLIGIFKLTLGDSSSEDWFAKNPIIFIGGIITFTLSFLAFFYMVINWFRSGRKCVMKVQEFLKRNLLIVMLALITVSFIPTVSYAVGMFLCTDYTCPAGTKFNPYADRDPESYDTSESRYCDRCDFTTSNQSTPSCGANVSAAFEYCPAFSGSRSWRNPESPCDDEATVYFYLAAVLVLVNYMLGIPLLFFHVIRYLSSHVAANAKIGRLALDESEDDRWIRYCAAIQPVAASLYDPFRQERRYYALAQLVHRLVITFVINIIAAYSDAAVVLVLVFHGVALLLLALTKPFIEKLEQVLGVGLAICNVLNSIYALVVWLRPSTPSYVAYIFIVLNGFVPVMLMVIVGIYMRRKRRQKGKEANEAAAVTQAQRERPYQVEEPYAAPATVGSHEATQDPYNVDDLLDISDAEERRLDQIPVAELTQAQLNQLERIHRYWDRHNANYTTIANQRSIDTLNKAFMLMGVFFVLALGIAFLGLFRASPAEYYVGSNSLYRAKNVMLGNYDTWDTFVAHCCCTEQTTPSPDFDVAERWVCENGRTIERGRVSGSDSGLPIRGLCSTAHNGGCKPVENTATKVVELLCPSQSPVPAQVTEFAIDFLW